MTIKVTVADTENGDTDTVELKDNYVVTTAGKCEVTSEQRYANGTVVLTIKRGAALEKHLGETNHDN